MTSHRLPILLLLLTALCTPATAQVIHDPDALNALLNRRARQEAAQEKAQAQQRKGKLTDEQMAAQVLSRLSFGPKAGQVQEVIQSGGWRTWAKQQLDPGNIDDSELDELLRKDFPGLFMNMSELEATYSPPNRIPRYIPGTKADSEAYLKRQREIKKLEYELILESQNSVIVRAAMSKRQLYEVAVEFWRNHFNINIDKRGVRMTAIHYEQNVIRRHAWGRFEDMLMASAKHPAMLVYLDNFVSQKPLSETEKRLLYQYATKKYKPRRVEASSRHRGLNENYARELMELHTLGVDNGYTQRDVIEIARVLTGWSVGSVDTGESMMNSESIDDQYGFIFRDEVHDTGPKRILGVRIQGNGGVEDGEMVIRGLARHRTTSEFISWKLCRYFVNDNPPISMVKRVAHVFRKSNGYLPDVYEAIIFDPEFAKPDNFRTKYKTPFEFAISTIRATDAKLSDLRPLNRYIHLMGQPIYRNEDPTGYYDQMEAWLDPGVLLYRWDLSLKLMRNKFKGLRVNDDLLKPYENMSPAEVREALTQALLGIEPSARTKEALEQVSKPRDIAALLLGSPEFQEQ